MKFGLFNGSLLSLTHSESQTEKAADNKVSSISFLCFQLCSSGSSQSFGSFVTQHQRSVLLHSLINREPGLMFVYSAVFVHFKPRPSISEINAGPFSHREAQKQYVRDVLMSLLWRWHEKKVCLLQLPHLYLAVVLNSQWKDRIQRVSRGIY